MRPMTKILSVLLALGFASAAAHAEKGAGAASTRAKAAPSTRAARPDAAEPGLVRATARDRFTAHLSSAKHVGSLDAEGQAQLFANLTARFGEAGRGVYHMFGADAALLMEVVSKSQPATKPDVGAAVSWELASRYGSKLLLVRTSSGFDHGHRYAPQSLSLQVTPPVGRNREAHLSDLEVFGISKPKHFERVLADAMERVAPEDYE